MSKHHLLDVVPGEWPPAFSTFEHEKPEPVPPTVWDSPNGPIPLTCQTSWCNQGHDMRYDDGHSRRCPDCVGGAPIIDWQVPCGKCEVMPDGRCPDCETVRVSIRPVPIIGSEIASETIRPETDHVEVYDGRARLWTNVAGQWTVTNVYLPNAKPGDYAIVGTEVK